MVRGTMVRGSVTVSEDEVRGTAGGADAVDVAGSEEPRESSDRAIVSVSEDEVHGTAGGDPRMPSMWRDTKNHANRQIEQ